ncbi:hypothetical protein D3C72_2408060 [compost metagenome]
MRLSQPDTTCDRAASGMQMARPMMVIQPMSPLTMAAPPTMPGCGGTTTCAASMMPATGRPNLMGLTPAALQKP